MSLLLLKMNREIKDMKKLKKQCSLSVFIILIQLSFGVLAAGETNNRDDVKYDFNPILLDSEGSDSSVLGVEYTFSDYLLSNEFDSVDDPDCTDYTCPYTIGSAKLKYEMKGVLAENSEKNPKNFIEFELDGSYLHAASDSTVIWSGGLFAKYEANQTFESKQFAYGITGAITKWSMFHDNDYIGFVLNIGTVDPSDDTDREEVLGTELDSYERVDIELVYRVPIDKGVLSNLEINYRYFKEVKSDLLIKNANLDEFRLITYHLSFNNGMYAAYSSGELPFNQRDNQIYEVGYTYKFD